MLPPKVSDCQKNCRYLQHSLMKFDRSNKLDLCYYGQVNSLRQKSSLALKWVSEHFWRNIYFAGDSTLLVIAELPRDWVCPTAELQERKIKTKDAFIMYYTCISKTTGRTLILRLGPHTK